MKANILKRLKKNYKSPIWFSRNKNEVPPWLMANHCLFWHWSNTCTSILLALVYLNLGMSLRMSIGTIEGQTHRLGYFWSSAAGTSSSNVSFYKLVLPLNMKVGVVPYYPRGGKY